MPLLIEVEKKETGLEYIERVLRYLTSGTDKITEGELIEILKEVYTEGERLMPTIAQQWIEQGISIGEKQGWTKGHQEGREEGRQETLVETLQQILTVRFGVYKGKFASRFAALDLATLKQLREPALTASTLAEFEAVLADTLPYQPGEKGPSAG